MRITVPFALALAVIAPSVYAGDRVQVTVFGGISLIDVGRDDETYPPCFIPVPAPAPPQDGGSLPFVPPCGPVFVRNTLGGSFLHGASIGYRVGRRAVLSGAFSTAPAHHLGVDGYDPRGRLVAHHLDAALEYEPFRVEADTRPFVSLGAGRIEYRGNGSYDVDGGDWSLNVGVGSSFRLAERARLRFEALDHVVTNHFLTRQAAHDVHVRIGLTVVP
jgi:hypothetical protein